MDPFVNRFAHSMARNCNDGGIAKEGRRFVQ